MDFIANTVVQAKSLVLAHTADAILALTALTILAILLALWSLLRRRGVRRLRRQVLQLEHRLRRLELSGERQQTVAAIRSPLPGPENL